VASSLFTFIDIQPQILSEAVGITSDSNSSSSQRGNTITTQTISPAQAAGILSSASSSATASGASLPAFLLLQDFPFYSLVKTAVYDRFFCKKYGSSDESLVSDFVFLQ